MKPSDNLFILIRSLNPAEKRYVKIFASKHQIGDENNYLKVYDEIAAQEQYDEEKLKKAFPGQDFIKHLPSIKVYLFKFILKSMRSYHSEKSLEVQLKEMLLDARFLFDKRMYDQSMEMLENAKKTARAYEKYPVLLEILIRERSIIIENESKRVKEKLQRLDEEINQALADVKIVMNLLKVKEQLSLITKERHYLRDSRVLEEIENLINTINLDREAETTPFDAKILQDHIYVLYYQLKGEYRHASNRYANIVKLYEGSVARQKEERGAYKKALSNYLNLCHSAGYFEEFKKILDKIRKIPQLSFEEEVATFKNITYLELLYNMNNDPDMAIAMLPALERDILKYSEHIHKSRELAFYYNIAMLCFVTEGYKNALKWLQKILNDEKSGTRQDIQDFARIFQLIVHYELNNIDILDYLTRSTLRYFQRKGNVFPFEMTILSHLKKIVWEEEKAQQKALFINCEMELEKIILDPVQKNTLGLKETLLWVNSKTTAMPIKQLVLAK